ncbi:hypothetical protein [Paenibacillus koleovorans]|uniref:hypothetical protein n=1 Tax=Paenibacillus koleovorans TaxID=121608 RepID=UPI000FDB641D|nr:hypothetical protein [Paenibacillus koleovorans]
MNRIGNAMQEVNMVAKLADLKEEHYRNSLLLSAMMELLIEKGILSRKEIESKMVELDSLMTPDSAFPMS